MERIANSTNGQQSAGKPILMVKIHKKSTIQKEKQQVKVLNNSELVTIKYQNAGILPFNKCLKDK